MLLKVLKQLKLTCKSSFPIKTPEKTNWSDSETETISYLFFCVYETPTEKSRSIDSSWKGGIHVSAGLVHPGSGSELWSPQKVADSLKEATQRGRRLPQQAGCREEAGSVTSLLTAHACACSRPLVVVEGESRSFPVRPSLHQLSGLSLLGPMNSTPSTGMSFSLMAFCTQRWYRRKVSVHGSPLRSPFRNFSANQRLKHWSYSRFSSVHASPTLFMPPPQKSTPDSGSEASGRVFKPSADPTCALRHFLTRANAIGWFLRDVQQFWNVTKMCLKTDVSLWAQL